MLVKLRNVKSFRARRDFLTSPGFREREPSRVPGVVSPAKKEEMMKKTLAVLATVAAVGATAVAAPAQARGIGPGLAFGLAAGAITAGAVAVFSGTAV